MFQAIRIFAFFIALPLMSLWWIFFTITVTFRESVTNKWRGISGVIGGLLFSTAIIVLDLTFRKSAQFPPTTPNIRDIFVILFTLVLIGFLAFLFIDRLIRNSMWQVAIFFTTAGGVASFYYLVALSQFRDIASLGILGFAIGWSICSRIFQNTLLSPLAIIISIFSPVYGMVSEEENIDKNAVDSAFDQREQKVDNQVNTGGIVISDRAVTIGGDVVGRDKIDLIGSSGGHKPVEDKTDEVYADLRKILNAIGKKFFKISIGHPQLISKGYASPFVVQLYFEELSNNVKTKIKKIIGEKYTERVYDTELKLGQVVKIKLFSPDIIFPEPIAKKLDSSINSMTFLGKPLETCLPGEHKVVLSILDNKTGIEFQSETFSVKVIDFAFDHVSRPLLSKVSTVVLGVGSFAMFILTLLEQIDKTIGLTSGTAAGILAAVIYANFYNLYQRIRSNTP
jgi:uncharacterized membrane protein YciS (DUF1049 family)